MEQNLNSMTNSKRLLASKTICLSLNDCLHFQNACFEFLITISSGFRCILFELLFYEASPACNSCIGGRNFFKFTLMTTLSLSDQTC